MPCTLARCKMGWRYLAHSTRLAGCSWCFHRSASTPNKCTSKVYFSGVCWHYGPNKLFKLTPGGAAYQSVGQLKVTHWQDPELHELASQFFRDFSRMEYALKATSFMNPKRRNAEADWSSFAVSIHAEINEVKSEEFAAAKLLLLSKPPKKQINNAGKIEWSEVAPDSKNETELLLKYVCRVRNNLFHGGKFNGHWFAPERSAELIQASCSVLKYCRAVSAEVSEAYLA